MKSIAIDFDGVVHKYSKGWHDGTIYDEPFEGAIEGIRSLMNNYYVFIFSTRPPEEIVGWFYDRVFIGEQLFPFKKIPDDVVFWEEQLVLGVTNRKLPAVAYIDDRAFLFRDWEGVLHSFN